MLDRLKDLLVKIEKSITEKTIIAFKGFSYSDLIKLDNKFFSSWDKIVVNKTNLEELKSQVLFSTFEVLQSEEKVFWMTYEELLISYETIKNNFAIKVVENNIFNKKFPHDGTIDNIKRVYESYFYNVEDEIKEDDRLEYSSIIEFYGDVIYSNESDRYYITYNDFLPGETEYINLYENIKKDYQVKITDAKSRKDNTLIIELSEDETAFLDLSLDLLLGLSSPEEVYITSMVQLSDLPNLYRERTEILQKLFMDKIKFYFTMKTMEVTDIDDIDEYLHILKKYWGYDSFRDLPIYKDVRSRERANGNIAGSDN